MRAHLDAASIFNADQTVGYEARYWDTAMSVASAGIEFAAFDIIDPTYDPNSHGTRNNINTRLNLNPDDPASDPATRDTRAILGYTGTVFTKGRVANICEYWGGGTILGGRESRYVMLKYTGNVKQAGTVALVFCGQGTVRAFKNAVELASTITPSATRIGTIHEPVTDYNVADFATRLDQAGYQYTTTTFVQGDQLDIYYWQKNEDWGGFCVKVISADIMAQPDYQTNFFEYLRNAPVLSASFLGVEAAGADLASTTIPYVVDVNPSARKREIGTAAVTVALATASESRGYEWVTLNGEYYLKDRNSSFVIKKGRRMQIAAGYGTKYERFTGYVDDFDIDAEAGLVTIQLRDYMGRMAEAPNENYPDRMSYHANGYVAREFYGEPVWNITAFDGWELEVAVAELAYRAGIDPKLLGKSHTSSDPSFGRRVHYDRTTNVVQLGRRLFKARLLASPSEKVRLLRNSNYGNVGIRRKDYLPTDDAYLFTPQLDTPYDQAQAMVEYLGYDLWQNPEGYFVLSSRNLADTFVVPAASVDAGATYQLDPAAVAGVYVRLGGAYQYEGHFSRLDLYAGVGTDSGNQNGGRLNVLVEVWNGSAWVTSLATFTVTTYYAGSETFYYDNVMVTGTDQNIAVIKLCSLPYDRYRVTLTPAGVDPSDATTTTPRYRVNGLAVFDYDPAATSYSYSLTTASNLLAVRSEARFEDMINQVIVVGSRKATITDSVKTNNEINPNNPEQEFHVSVAADPHSVWNPLSANYVGGKRTALIFDTKVVDSDYAAWLARTALLRYRSPLHQLPNVRHTAIPVLEIGDVINVVEDKYDSVNMAVRVVGYREVWTMNEAIVDLEVESYPEIPSYVPREDVDIDTYYNGEPVSALTIKYKNIYDEDISNFANPDLLRVRVDTSRPTNSTAVVLSSNRQTYTGAIIPETMFLSQNVNKDSASPLATQRRVLVNTPYRHFWFERTWTGTGTSLQVEYDFEEADGTAGLYNMAYYNFPNLNGNTWYMNWDTFRTRTGLNPFYDPYSSEIGKFVTINFDALVSGRYRVSVWDARKQTGRETLVAWLTSPTNDPTEAEAHWQYVDAGSSVEFLWDGVDNVGIWNRMQSDEFGRELEGAFGDQPTAVGAGFYAWNDHNTNPFTQIGDVRTSNYGTTAGMPAGQPAFTIGKYGQFYIRVEVWNDEIQRRTAETAPREVNSTGTRLNGDAVVNSTPGYVWTHLGEPSKVDMSFEDYDGAAWQTVPDATASIRNDRPVRMKFTPRARRGVQFGNLASRNSVRLAKHVYMKATVFDEFWTLFGTPWDVHRNGANGVEKKRVTARMYHTPEEITFGGDEWLNGDTIAQTIWEFKPEHFKKDFGTGREESLRYGDYDQVGALPGFDPAASPLEARSRILWAYVSYLFYFSAFTLDRSGRRQWCLNPLFRDKSKIVTTNWLNDAATNSTHYRVREQRTGKDRYLTRSIYTRQWVEPGWKKTVGSPVIEGNPIDRWGIVDAHQLKFVQPLVTDFDPGSTALEDVNASWLDYHIQAHRHNGALPADQTDVNRIINDTNGGTHNYAPYYTAPGTGLGTWSFDKPALGLTGFFYPNPVRDFHPFWKLPVMPSSRDETVMFDTSHGVSYLGVPASRTSGSNEVRDVGAHEIWYGYMFSHTRAMTRYNETTQAEDRLQYFGTRVEKTAEDYLTEADRSREMTLAVFDFERQDELDKFDMFRGIRSRTAYTDRTSMPSYWNSGRKHGASAQPVMANGSPYLINTMRYDKYWIGPIHLTDPGIKIHYISSPKDMFSIRFRHEYVWYSANHFPVDSENASMYCYFRNEYTRASDMVPFAWRARQNRTALYFDSGAWTGWKDDLTSAQWTSTPRIRWAENMNYTVMDGTFSNPHHPQQHENHNFQAEQAITNQSWPDTLPALNPETEDAKEIDYRAANIFDEMQYHGFFRLAVGPELPQSKVIYMNLMLPEKYA